MTKLEQWERDFNREAANSGHGACTRSNKGGVYTREVLHFHGISGSDDPSILLCTDGKTLGFHRIGLCPFIVTPDQCKVKPCP